MQFHIGQAGSSEQELDPLSNTRGARQDVQLVAQMEHYVPLAQFPLQTKHWPFTMLPREQAVQSPLELHALQY